MSRLVNSPLAEFDPSGGRVKITAGWGDGRGHKGVDLGSLDGIEVGTPIYAPADGQVVRIANDGPFRPPNGHTAGINLWFLADDGRRYKMFHMNRVTVPLNVPVKAGQQIAEVGRSGTPAAHLHMEEHDGSWANPVDFTADMQEVLAAGRFPGTVVEPENPEEPDMPLDQADKDFIVNEIRNAVRPVVLETPSGKYLWDRGLPVPAGDVQIQYVANLIGAPNAYSVNDEFVGQLRAGIGCVGGGAGADAAAIAAAIVDQLGDDLARQVSDEIADRLAD